LVTFIYEATRPLTANRPPGISANHLYGITGLEEFDPALSQ